MPLVWTVRTPGGPPADLRAVTFAASGRIFQIFTKLGIQIDPQLFELAMTHRSWAYENGGEHNERLEFLGDAVLGFVVTDDLYRRFPQYPEGRLAKLRSAVVNTASLADVGRQLEIGTLVKLGRGETMTAGYDKDSILADTMEAIIGSVLLSCGRDDAERFVSHVFIPRITEADKLGAGLDWKTSLQELCAALGVNGLSYTHESTGPDHDKRFTATVVAGEHRITGGVARSKKLAEQDAAEKAFALLSPGGDQDSGGHAS